MCRPLTSAKPPAPFGARLAAGWRALRAAGARRAALRLTAFFAFPAGLVLRVLVVLLAMVSSPYPKSTVSGSATNIGRTSVLFVNWQNAAFALRRLAQRRCTLRARTKIFRNLYEIGPRAKFVKFSECPRLISTKMGQAAGTFAQAAWPSEHLPTD